MKSWIVAALAVCLVAAGAPLAGAQEARGTLQGRVSDASGAVVPGATVEIANIATGVTTPTTSNEEGNYRVPFLNPGTYRVTVTLDGFSKFVSQNIELHVAEVLHGGRHAAGGTGHRRSDRQRGRHRGRFLVGPASGRSSTRAGSPSCRSAKARRSSS